MTNNHFYKSNPIYSNYFVTYKLNVNQKYTLFTPKRKSVKYDN